MGKEAHVFGIIKNININSNPSLHDKNTTAQNPSQRNAQSPLAKPQSFKLGLDVDLNYVVVAVQCDHGTIKPAQKLTRPQLLAWVKDQVAAGHSVHTVYECCGFGYTLHEELTAAGAHSLVTTPLRLNLEHAIL